MRLTHLSAAIEADVEVFTEREAESTSRHELFKRMDRVITA